MADFHHERLAVYGIAQQFLTTAEDMASSLQRGRSYLADQLRRAALSIVLNVAEGAGEFAAAEKARFYRFARRSATESVAIIDSCKTLGLVDEALVTQARRLLREIVAILTAMVLKIDRLSSARVPD